MPDKKQIIEAVAEYFGIEPDRDGEFHLSSYEWQAGCSMGRGGMWLNLAAVVDCVAECIEKLDLVVDE